MSSTTRKKYANADNDTLRKLLTLAIHTALEEFFGGPMHVKIHSSSITHTDLQPEGDTFTINFVAETHEKKNDPADIPAKSQ